MKVRHTKGIANSQFKASGWPIRFNWLCLLILWFSPLIMPAQEASVTFSASGGFYDKPFVLSLSCSDGCSIHYTTNGNIPCASDPIYEEPLLLDEKLYSKSNIYTIQTCPDSVWFVPTDIKKCIVIRAAAFDENGNHISPVTTNSYFIKSLVSYPSNLPVISLCSDSISLFGQEEGILLQEGNHHNSLQQGREWERLCNVEFYNPDNSGINQLAGLRTHGGDSRLGMQKGMRIYARKEYGQKRFNYSFFKNTNIHSNKNLVLKPLGTGLISDHICTQIAQPLNFETPQSLPVVLFLNGEYWGLYFLKERPDERFISDHYGFDRGSVNIIQSWIGNPSCGNNENFIKMIRWFMNADLSNANEYKQACQLIDIKCFIDYYCFQLFISNSDWPHNNMRCWQANDGKWRWIFYDGDCALLTNPNMLVNTLYNENNKNISTLIFTKLLGNECFRDDFYERFGELLIHEFDPKNTKAYFSNCINAINPELDFHYNRFGYTVNIMDYHDRFLSISVVNAASMIYKLYYYNNWKYNKSKVPSQSTFKCRPNCDRPVFLFRMARQFKDWKFVRYYFSYEPRSTYYKIKSSRLYKSMKSNKLWYKLKGVK